METGLSAKIILVIIYTVCNLAYLAKMDVDYTDRDIVFNFTTIISSIIFLPGFIIFCLDVIFRSIIKTILN